jgi:hypothetical protein
LIEGLQGFPPRIVQYAGIVLNTRKRVKQKSEARSGVAVLRIQAVGIVRDFPIGRIGVNILALEISTYDLGRGLTGSQGHRRETQRKLPDNLPCARQKFLKIMGHWSHLRITERHILSVLFGGNPEFIYFSGKSGVKRQVM